MTSDDRPTDERTPARQLAHEIRSPLTVIDTGLEALKVTVGDTESTAELITMIQRDGVGPLRELIAQLVDLATDLERR